MVGCKQSSSSSWFWIARTRCILDGVDSRRLACFVMCGVVRLCVMRMFISLPFWIDADLGSGSRIDLIRRGLL